MEPVKEIVWSPANGDMVQAICDPDGKKLFELLFEYSEEDGFFSVNMRFEGASGETAPVLDQTVVEAEINVVDRGAPKVFTKSLNGASDGPHILLADSDDSDGWCLSEDDTVSLRFLNTFPSIQKTMEKINLLEAMKGMEGYENFQREQIESFSDIVIRAGERSIKCHKVVLAHRSQVFNAMLKHDMVEQTSNEIHVEDFDEETVQSMVVYIYGGELPERAKFDIELLRIADKYNIERMKRECEFRLTYNLCWESVAQVWSIANMCGSDDLKKSTVEFLKKHWDEEGKREELVKILMSHSDIIPHIVPFMKIM